jgi:hypothetical protein
VSGRTEGLARSVHDRLVRHARTEGLDPTLVFARYGLERFLYRLSRSQLDVIRTEDSYGGRRISFFGGLGSGRIKVQLDVGIGDATVPEPEWLELPTLLDLPRPRIRAYRPETVVAEKLHAIVHLGLANTRLKDVYDLLVLSRTQTFDGDLLRNAIEATFQRRRTELPDHEPAGLSAEFASEARTRQWSAFAARNQLAAVPELPDALAELRAWLAPPVWRRSTPS